MDENKMIEIVKFERKENEILVGYRQNGRVVYASVLSKLDDATAKQRAYEQVREALIYEQTLEKPSINGSEMEPIEVFTPAEPVTTSVRINGPTVFTFDDDAAENTVTFTAVAYDQYGDIVSTKNIERTFINDDYNENVSVTIDGVSAMLGVTIQKYREPMPTLEEQLAEKDLRIKLLEESQAATDSTVLELMETILLGGM